MKEKVEEKEREEKKKEEERIKNPSHKLSIPSVKRRPEGVLS